jgi:hypothetical protein
MEAGNGGGYLLSQPFQTALTPNIFRFTDPIWQSCDRARLRLKIKDDPESPVVIKRKKQRQSMVNSQNDRLRNIPTIVAAQLE